MEGVKRRCTIAPGRQPKMLGRGALTRRGLALGLAPAIRLVTHSLLVLALCGWAAIAGADDAKRVLILHSNQSVLPATVAADSAIRREMQSGTSAPLEVFSEFLVGRQALPGEDAREVDQPGFNIEVMRQLTRASTFTGAASP